MSNSSTPTSASVSGIRSLDYALVDVFAERPLEGNALAIFTDARGLTTGEMQALARETNLCETTFIIPRAPDVERQHGIQVRIFTVQEELEFAGHPTLGTASWLHLNHPVLGGNEIHLGARCARRLRHHAAERSRLRHGSRPRRRRRSNRRIAG
jgi:trans-2,3-dihydro-3-hydroxyanthranilate isomerase